MIGAITAGLFSAGTPAVTNSYESIATANGTGSSGTITFSSIPSTYKHLQLRFYVRGTSGVGGYPTDMNWIINSDTTTTNYYTHSIDGNGSSATARANNGNSSYFTSEPSAVALSNTYGVWIVDILDYASTNKLKTLRNLGGGDFNGSGNVRLSSMLWNNTAAINSISIVLDATYGGNFTTGSQIALYGIKG